MPVPRVFISSTYFDLRHIRASLDQFIRSLGFEIVLSEKGDIAYSYDRALDESCYREVGTSDMLVLIVGGRTGAIASDAVAEDGLAADRFFERYDSITRREYEKAAEADIPTFVLVDAGVFSEYQTFKSNRDNATIRYPSVDTVNVFSLLDDILARPRNNPVQPFTTFSDAETWLRKQWAGLFGELLKRSSEERKLAELSVQVDEMRDLNQTLKTYMETVVSSVAPDASERIISTEQTRLADSSARRDATRHPLIGMLIRSFDIEREALVDIIVKAASTEEIYEHLAAGRPASDEGLARWRRFLALTPECIRDIDDIRAMFDRGPVMQTLRDEFD